MPVDRKLYPTNWEAFSISIRAGRALHRCECTGECGLHQPSSKEPGHGTAQSPAPRRCLEVNHQHAKFGNGRIVLTVAHLCNCYPICANPGHVKAMCQRCHLRVDMARHKAARLRTIATPSYKSQRYRALGKAIHFEDLETWMKLPKKKRTRFWIGA